MAEARTVEVHMVEIPVVEILTTLRVQTIIQADQNLLDLSQQQTLLATRIKRPWLKLKKYLLLSIHLAILD